MVALAVPAVEGEGDLLLRQPEAGFEVLSGDCRVVEFQVEFLFDVPSALLFNVFVSSLFVFFPFGTVYITLNGDNSKSIMHIFMHNF